MANCRQADFSKNSANSKSDLPNKITSNVEKNPKLHYRYPQELPTDSDNEYYDVKVEPDNDQSKSQISDDQDLNLVIDEQDLNLVIDEPKLLFGTSGTKIGHALHLKMLARLSRFSLTIHRLSIDKYKSPLVTTEKRTFTKPKRKIKTKGTGGSSRALTRAEIKRQDEIEEIVKKNSLSDLPMPVVSPVNPIHEFLQIEIPPETCSTDTIEIQFLTDNNVILPQNEFNSPQNLLEVSTEYCDFSQNELTIDLDLCYSPKRDDSPLQILMDDSPPEATSPIQSLIYEFDNSPQPVISPLQIQIDDSQKEFTTASRSPTIKCDNSPKQFDSLSIVQYDDEDIINIRVSPTLFPDSPPSKILRNNIGISSRKNTPSNLDLSSRRQDFHWTPIHFRQQKRQQSPNGSSDNESPKGENSKISPSRRSQERKSPSRKSPSLKSPLRKSPLRKSPSRKSPSRKSPSRKSPSRKSPSKGSRHSPSKRSPKRSPRRSPRQSPHNSPSMRSPRYSPSRRSPKRSPRSSPSRRDSRRSPRRSPRRSSSRRSPSRRSPRRSPRYSPSRRSPRRSPYRRSSRSPRTSPSRRSPNRRSPPRRTPPRKSPSRWNSPRRSPVRSSHSTRSPLKSPTLRSPLFSSRRSPNRRSPVAYRHPPARRSPYRDRPSPHRLLGRLSPQRDIPVGGIRSPPRGRPLYRSSSRSLSRSPVRRQSSFGSPVRHRRDSPHRLEGRLSPGLIDHHRDRARSPVWDYGPIRTINDRSRSKSPAKISINLPPRLRDRNNNQDEKKIVRVESPVSMSISPQTSTQEDDADTMRIVSRSSIRNRIALSPMRPPHLQRSRSSSPITRPFHTHDEFFDRDSLSPKYPEERRDFLRPLSPKNARISKLPIVSYNYNPEIDIPVNTSRQDTLNNEPDEFSPYSILENMFKDDKGAQSEISLYLPTEEYISKELPPPLAFEPEKDPTLIPFSDRTVICPLCKTVLYAKRYELHILGKCIFRSQLPLNPAIKNTESVLPEANQFSQDSMNISSADNYSLSLIPSVEQRSFKCPDKLCEYRGQISFLRDHYQQMHVSFNCFNCKQRIVDPNTFPNHLSKCLNKSPIVCPLCVCHYPLLNSYSLGHHILNQHSTEICIICKQQISWKYFTAHVIGCMFNSQHRYRCPICNSSVRIDTLADHILTKHYRDACALCKRMTGTKPIIHVSKCFLDVTGMNLNYIRPENKVRCTMCSFQTTFSDTASHYLKSHPYTKCVFCENIFDIKGFANHIGICCQIHDAIPKSGLIHINRPPILSNTSQISAFKQPTERKGISGTNINAKFGPKASYISTPSNPYPFGVNSQRPFLNTSTQQTLKQISSFAPTQQKPARPSKFSNRKL